MNIRSNPDTTLPAVTTGPLPSSRKIFATPEAASDLRVPLRDLQSRITPGQINDNVRTLADVEREHIRATLKETRWRLSGPGGAAMRLGLNRSTLYFRMKKLGIVRPWY